MAKHKNRLYPFWNTSKHAPMLGRCRPYSIKSEIHIDKIIIDLYVVTDTHKQDSVVWNEPSPFFNAASVLLAKWGRQR